jgi:DnaJ-domain-containing protein 1
VLETNRNKRTRKKIAVSLDLGEGEELLYMFVSPQERIIDTLNDERDFIPFERADGSVLIVAKTMIRTLAPRETASASIVAGDPYDLLGIHAGATDAEVQEAYHRAVSAVHPDRVHSLGLPEDFLDMATRRAALLNDAYRKIRKMRKSDADDPAA